MDELKKFEDTLSREPSMKSVSLASQTAPETSQSSPEQLNHEMETILKINTLINSEHNPDILLKMVLNYALELTGDVLYLSLPAVGTLLERGKSMGSLEAGKWIGRLEAPLSGTVSHLNETALQQPTLINSEPYQHWLLEVVWTNEAEQQQLLSALQAAKQAEEWEENAQS